MCPIHTWATLKPLTSNRLVCNSQGQGAVFTWDHHLCRQLVKHRPRQGRETWGRRSDIMTGTERRLMCIPPFFTPQQHKTRVMQGAEPSAPSSLVLSRFAGNKGVDRDGHFKHILFMLKWQPSVWVCERLCVCVQERDQCICVILILIVPLHFCVIVCHFEKLFYFKHIGWDVPSHTLLITNRCSRAFHPATTSTYWVQ